MVDFFGSRLLRWLTVPYRSRLFNVASKPFNQVADRVLGSRFLQDIAEFFILFQAMETGFVRPGPGGRGAARRPAHDVRRRHHAGGGAGARGRFLARELAERAVASARSIANRVMPPALHVARRGDERHAARRRGRRRAISAVRGRRRAEAIARGRRRRRRRRRPRARTRSPSSFHDVALVATREAERRAELAALAPQVLDVEALPSDVHDLAGLLATRSVTCR